MTSDVIGRLGNRGDLRLPEMWSWGEDLCPLKLVIERGGLLAIPTESSYGLAADPRSRSAVDLIFRVKSRQETTPLPVVAGDRLQIESLGGIVGDGPIAAFADAWPAPLTLVLPLRSPVPAAAGGDTLGFRIPAHAELRGLLQELGTAMTATSANRSGEPPLLDPQAVRGMLAGVDAIVIDDGMAPGGPPSTLIQEEGGSIQVLREGRFLRQEIERILTRGRKRGDEVPGKP